MRTLARGSRPTAEGLAKGMYLSGASSTCRGSLMVKQMPSKQLDVGSSPTPRSTYWYFITINECPLCGRSHEYRERQYTPKPVDAQHRYKYEQHWCYCDF